MAACDTNTTAELDFSELTPGTVLSPAQILLNLAGWIEADMSAQVSPDGEPSRLNREEARKVRVDTLLDVKNWMERLGSCTWT